MSSSSPTGILFLFGFQLTNVKLYFHSILFTHVLGLLFLIIVMYKCLCSGIKTLIFTSATFSKLSYKSCIYYAAWSHIFSIVFSYIFCRHFGHLLWARYCGCAKFWEHKDGIHIIPFAQGAHFLRGKEKYCSRPGLEQSILHSWNRPKYKNAVS